MSHKNIIAFRVDSASFIGIGHLKRCIAIANELKRLGFKCIFISTEFKDSNYDDVHINEHELITLRNKITMPRKIQQSNLWLCKKWIDDANETLSILQEKNCKYIFVDHYGISQEWESHIKNFNISVMTIDDIDREHDVDLFIDYSFWKHRTDVEKRILRKSDCKFLLGKDYLPLIGNFKDSIIKNKNFHNPTILITLGGYDNEGLGLKIIKILEDLKHINIKKVIIVTDKENELPIKSSTKKSRLSYEIHVCPNNLGCLYSKSDICFGASGVSAYERIYFEIPQLIFVKAQNQNETAENFLKNKFSKKVEDFSFENIKKFITIFLDKNNLYEMHSNLHGFINLNGAQNIATSIKEFVIEKND